MIKLSSRESGVTIVLVAPDKAASSIERAFKYSAFISYSHQEERWARWLQNALETYRVPARLVGRRTTTGQIVPKRLEPVCRDRSDLSSSADLTENIKNALEQSRSLIVICSPKAASSRWVNLEISLFSRLGRVDRIFCLIVAGEPNASEFPGREGEECFPEALRFRDAIEGVRTPRRFDPTAADVRRGRDGKVNAKLKLISGLLDVGLDSLKQRDLRRRHQRMVAITAVASVLTLIASGLAIEALIARHAAEQRQKAAESLVGFMLGDLNDKLRHVQRLDILEAVNDQAMAYFLTLPSRNVTDQALALRASALQKIGEVRSDQGNLPAALESHQAASALAAERLRRAPGDADRQAAYAETLNFIGRTYWFQGELNRAFENFQRAIALFEQATRAPSPDSRWAALASARTNAGRVLEARGDFDYAKGLYQAVRATFETLASHDESGTRWQSELADAYDSLGKLALEQGQLTAAIAAYRNVQLIRARLSTKSPGDRAAQEDLVLSDAILGRALSLCGSERLSVHYVSEAVSTVHALVAYDATYTDWREEYGEYSSLLGSLDRMQRRWAESATHDREALRVLSDLVAADKTNASWRQALASTEVERARLELAEGQLAQAQASLQPAIETIVAQRDVSPDDRNLRLLEAQAYLVRGEVLLHQGDSAAAREDWIRARTVMATAARVGADPNFLCAWAMALLLLDDLNGARPILDQLAAMGYQTPDLHALVLAKNQRYDLSGAATRCPDDESQLTAAFDMP
jgi:eukaryotic-like serine/threonine-protein kinase